MNGSGYNIKQESSYQSMNYNNSHNQIFQPINASHKQIKQEQNHQTYNVGTRHQGQPRADDLGSKTRQDNSLGELTRKFIALIQESENKSVDLNDAAKKLDV